MSKYKIGTKLNYLTILKFTQDKPYKKVLCRCDCGKEKELYLSNIVPRNGNSRITKSCGCMWIELTKKHNTKHGLSGTKFYKHWRSMFDRMKPAYINYYSYKKIKICKRWDNFENFKKDMYQDFLIHEAKYGGRQTTLDRINVKGGYSKKNCRWATQKEQGVNKTNTTFVIFNEIKKPLIYIAREFNIKEETLRRRIKVGYTPEQAISYKLWQGNKTGQKIKKYKKILADLS